MRPTWIFPVALFALFGSAVAPALAAGPVSGGDPATAATGSDFMLLIVFVAVALLFSFACSIAESVLLSITPSYVEGLRGASPARAELLKRLRQDNVDRSLAAILTLNTIAHTAGAIGAGTQAAVVFGSVWTGVFSAAMTLAILFFSEIVPKTIGTVYWRALVGPTLLFIRILIVVLYPLVWISEWLTRLIARGRDVQVFSRQEFLAMADVAEEGGHIDVHESRIFRNLFRFESLKAKDSMTPRTVIMAFPEDFTVSQALAGSEQIAFSRLPLFQGDLDHITGFVLKDEMLMYEARDEGDEPLTSLKREILAVPEGVPLSKLLDLLLERREHIAVVVDEYGGTSGLVTLEDVVETLLGMEIVDEMDDVEDMQVHARELSERRSARSGESSDGVSG